MQGLLSYAITAKFRSKTARRSSVQELATILPLPGESEFANFSYSAQKIINDAFTTSRKQILWHAS